MEADERVDGRETVGNSLGRAPVGRSDTGVMTGWTEGKTMGELGGHGWTEGKPWEIAWGELRWHGDSCGNDLGQGGRKR